MALGEACYSVLAQRRGGAPFMQLPWTSLAWERRLDDTSSASVTVPLSALRRGMVSQIGQVEPWTYEIALRRPGEVWVGPVTETEWTDAGLQLRCRDVTQWFERRVLRFRHDFDRVDLATIFATLAADAMYFDPSPNITVTPALTHILGSRQIFGKELRIAADELRELARDGLDYTTVGREVLCGGLEVPVPRLPPLTKAGMADARLSELGLLTADQVWVLGSSSSTAKTPVTGRAGGPVSARGLVERVFSESSIIDNASCAQAARTRWEALNLGPVSLTCNLRPRQAPSIDQLVPGALWPVEATIGARSIDRVLRLASVSVNASASAAGTGQSNETVAVELIEAGSAEASG